MILKNNQKQRLREGLGKAFTLSELTILVSDFLHEDMENIVVDGNKTTRIHELLGWAERRGNTLQLVDGAIKRRPTDESLQLLAEELGMHRLSSLGGPMYLDISKVSQHSGQWVKPSEISTSLTEVGAHGKTPKRVLQRTVQELGNWSDFKTFVERLSLLGGQVCRVVIGTTGGTGFLVAPDLVMTNHHVIKSLLPPNPKNSLQDCYCLFDYFELSDGSSLPGERVKFATDWLQAHSPPSPSDDVVDGPDPANNECDFAIIKLADDLGARPVGPTTADARAPNRGWIDIADPPPPGRAGEAVFLLQHPRKRQMHLAHGRVLGFNQAGNRLRHDATTLVGSSGSPCFNVSLELIALHHAGDPDFDPDHRPEYNQAVPLSPILDLLKGHDSVEPFWEAGSGD